MKRRAASAWWVPLFLLLGVVVTCYPRFNDTNAGDTHHYVDLVSYFRGPSDSLILNAPFAYRMAGPILASLLPLEPMTALNVVNVVALGIAALLIYEAIYALRNSLHAAFAGSACFVFSFPTFQYGTIGYVEPVLILFLTLFAFALCTQNHWLAAISFIVGCLAKEMMLLVVPAYVAFAVLRPTGTRARNAIQAALVIFAALTVLFATARLIPVTDDLTCTPALSLLVANASRPRAWLSGLLAFGIPGFLLVLLLCQKTSRARLFRHRVGVPLLLGALGSIGLVGAAWCAAYADGRTFWTLYPLALPMVALMWPPSVVEERNLGGSLRTCS